ncbi:MAG TPA: SDR family oxidoreductase [Burkholderiales bacterium]|nr:SDR family oxidoreductase [Burkholderiales bacterium]
MRILILGGSGMLGHQLLKQLSLAHDARVTLRGKRAEYSAFGLFNAKNAYPGIELSSIKPLAEVVKDFQPQVIVNAAGIIKQKPEAKEIIPSLEINSLLPHRLAMLCEQVGARLIHMSTDCVFSGRKGGYRESDVSDAGDLYGKSKFLGEVHGPRCLTLRTSIIGRELIYKTGLLEWFLAQRGTVRGFTHAIFSGFTTLEMARIMENIITGYPRASGLYHVSSEPISKYDLLLMIKRKMRLGTEIIPDGEFKCDRSLDSTKFRSEFKYNPPNWEVMIDELAQDYLGRTK